MDDAHRLISACFSSLADAQALLLVEPDLLSTRTELGETPLHYLAVEDQMSAVEWLIARGAPVNVVNAVGTTPLADAASLGYVGMVELLLQHGAQVNAQGEREPTLHSAVRSGVPEIVNKILAAGADIDEVSEHRDTALHIAAESDDMVEVLRALVSAGANIHARRLFDETPLDVAIRGGSVKAVALLESLGPLASQIQ